MLNMELKRERATALLNAYKAVEYLKNDTADDLKSGRATPNRVEALKVQLDMYVEILELLNEYDYQI